MFQPEVKSFFDKDTWTLSYLVSDPSTGDAIVIDPVLNYDAIRCQTDIAGVMEIADYITERGLVLRAVLETHAHADHLSGARFLAERFDVPVGIGADITLVQGAFAKILNLDTEVSKDGSQFDRLLQGGQSYEFGSVQVEALATPGHTPACLSYHVGDAVFTGDALFIEDYGTGRTDFPAGSAAALYHSVHEVLYKLPGETRVFVGHDYQPGGRDVRCETTISASRQSNVQLRQATKQDEFIEFRDRRDNELRPPRLIFQSVQVNVFGGYLPQEQGNGVRYLKSPLNMRKRTDAAGKPVSSS